MRHFAAQAQPGTGIVNVFPRAPELAQSFAQTFWRLYWQADRLCLTPDIRAFSSVVSSDRRVWSRGRALCVDVRDRKAGRIA
jgi:hypothetical protein